MTSNIRLKQPKIVDFISVKELLISLNFSSNVTVSLINFFFNCSQTKFVAIILVLSVFFYAIFRLNDFSSDAFDFSSSKTG